MDDGQHGQTAVQQVPARRLQDVGQLGGAGGVAQLQGQEGFGERGGGGEVDVGVQPAAGPGVGQPRFRGGQVAPEHLDHGLHGLAAHDAPVHAGPAGDGQRGLEVELGVVPPAGHEVGHGQAAPGPHFRTGRPGPHGQVEQRLGVGPDHPVVAFLDHEVGQQLPGRQQQLNVAGLLGGRQRGQPLLHRLGPFAPLGVEAGLGHGRHRGEHRRIGPAAQLDQRRADAGHVALPLQERDAGLPEPSQVAAQAEGLVELAIGRREVAGVEGRDGQPPVVLGRGRGGSGRFVPGGRFGPRLDGAGVVAVAAAGLTQPGQDVGQRVRLMPVPDQFGGCLEIEQQLAIGGGRLGPVGRGQQHPDDPFGIGLAAGRPVVAGLAVQVAAGRFDRLGQGEVQPTPLDFGERRGGHFGGERVGQPVADRPVGGGVLLHQSCVSKLGRRGEERRFVGVGGRQQDPVVRRFGVQRQQVDQPAFSRRPAVDPGQHQVAHHRRRGQLAGLANLASQAGDEQRHAGGPTFDVVEQSQVHTG